MFQFYPKTTYRVNDFDSIRGVDITVSVKVKDFINSFRGLAIRPYTVKNGERPDLVSSKIYGTPKYEYILLLVNGIDSIYDQWPRDNDTLNNYIAEKYGSVSFAQNNIGFWYTGTGRRVSQEYWSTLNDSNKYTENFFQYETRLNDAKANIRIIDIVYIIQFESGLQEIFNN